MNAFALLTFLVLVSGSVAHSKYERPLRVAGPQQNYVVVDETIWRHARSDLGDIRLLAGDAEVPYVLLIERGSHEQERRELTVLQQARVAGKTQFLIDMSGLTEYDRVELNLSTRDFVAHATVEGQDDPHGTVWANLGRAIVYDLSSEDLGSNTTLRLPRSTYRYLRVTLDGPVRPKDVRGATSEKAASEPAAWRNVSGSSTAEQDGKDTVFTFSLAENLPIERVVFAFDSSMPNFRRSVEVKNDKDMVLGSGDIRRVHMVHSGEKIDSERDDVSISAIGKQTIKVIIHNGDDRPLKINSARLQQLERRVYFEAPANSEVNLYYGNPKLKSPVYDYAALFQQDKSAAPAEAGTEIANRAYSEPADDRPWSERHPVVLWIAIVAAVLCLGMIALRSMLTASA